MKICVLNGSPKGDLSVTLQSIRWIEKKFAGKTFTIHNVGQKIRRIVDREEVRKEILDDITAADLILFSQPVYTFTVPSQVKQFVELIFATDLLDAMSGKYAAVITTSVNFFDHAAHAYMRGVLEDMGMQVAGMFSADSYDLLEEKERMRLVGFAADVFETVTKKRPVSRAFAPLVTKESTYGGGPAPALIDPGARKVVIVQDQDYTGTAMGAMIERVAARFAGADRMVLSDIEIAGGCLGCIQCGFDHRCAYSGKDQYVESYENRIKPADLIFFAGKTKDRMLSSKWKEFFDRGFYNTHTPTMVGKQIGFILSGPVGQLGPFRETLVAFAEWQGANLVDIVTDEYPDSRIDALLDAMAEKAVECAERGFVMPATFLGKGGMKVFRDDVFGRHRFVFQADHEWFEKNGIYDFPQDDKRAMETNAFMFEMMKDPNAKEAIRKMLKSEMVKPIKKVVEEG